jgi:hypothetical protein
MSNENENEFNNQNKNFDSVSVSESNENELPENESQKKDKVDARIISTVRSLKKKKPSTKSLELVKGFSDNQYNNGNP